MSRSYRKPYSAITGHSSADWDKTLARRGVRRAQNEALQTCLDWDEFMFPHKYECSWNETYCWGRDGKQWLNFPPDPPKDDSEFELWWYERQLKYYARLHRK